MSLEWFHKERRYVVDKEHDDLPAIRVEVARESYSDAFMDELAREHRALRGRERMRSESPTPLPL